MSEKIIYENESGRLTAKADGGVVDLVQEIGGQVVGSVSMYYGEISILNEFINQKSEKEKQED